MTDFDRVVIEADSTGRLSICAEDADGGGEGYLFPGPKHVGDLVHGTWQARPVVRHELTAVDVDEIRRHLAIWDEIQARGLR